MEKEIKVRRISDMSKEEVEEALKSKFTRLRELYGKKEKKEGGSK